MWGAIIQAIDHAMGRTQKGMSAGIDVANSQHGGAAGSATTSNEQIDTSKTGENIKSVANGAAKQELNAQVGKLAGSGASEGASTSAGAGTAAGSGVLPKGIESTGASEGVRSVTGSEGTGDSGGVAEAASNILSDENAKTSKPVSKLQSVRAYGANAGKGFANAGAIATGSKAAEWENIDNSFAKKAAEDTVKGWRKKDFKSDSTNIKKSK